MTEASRARGNGGISPAPASSPRAPKRTATPLFEEVLQTRGIQASAVLHKPPPGPLRGPGANCLHTGLGGSRRPLTGRPRSSRFQAPPDSRPAWNPARRHAHRRQPPRCHPVAAAARRGSTDPGAAKAASPQAAAPVCRPGLRLRQVPPLAVEARHQADDRPTRRGPRFRARQGALGSGTGLRLAAPVQTAPDPLRKTRRPPSGPARTGLQPHLPPSPAHLTMKRAVS